MGDERDGFWNKVKKVEDAVLPPKSPRRAVTYILLVAGLGWPIARDVVEHGAQTASQQVSNELKPTIERQGRVARADIGTQLDSGVDDVKSEVRASINDNAEKYLGSLLSTSTTTSTTQPNHNQNKTDQQLAMRPIHEPVGPNEPIFPPITTDKQS